MGNKIITVVTTILVIIIIILVGILSLNKTTDQFVWQCYLNYFSEDLEIKGDFSGTINCTEYYEINYADGKWIEKCSTNLFSLKTMSCHDLCNIDCAYTTKKSGGKFVCIC